MQTDKLSKAIGLSGYPGLGDQVTRKTGTKTFLEVVPDILIPGCPSP